MDFPTPLGPANIHASPSRVHGGGRVQVIESASAQGDDGAGAGEPDARVARCGGVARITEEPGAGDAKLRALGVSCRRASVSVATMSDGTNLPRRRAGVWERARGAGHGAHDFELLLALDLTTDKWGRRLRRHTRSGRGRRSIFGAEGTPKQMLRQHHHRLVHDQLRRRPGTTPGGSHSIRVRGRSNRS